MVSTPRNPKRADVKQPSIFQMHYSNCCGVALALPMHLYLKLLLLALLARVTEEVIGNSLTHMIGHTCEERSVIAAWTSG